MLVLTRKQNQEIIIGDNIKITVLKMKGNTVRLGIEAPRDVNVIRGELPRHETPTSSVDESSESPAADFTVVFSNSDVIPFQQRGDSNRISRESGANRQTNRAPQQDDCNDGPKSVQFRGVLPAPLHHNRLKEIVNKLTAKPKS